MQDSLKISVLFYSENINSESTELFRSILNQDYSNIQIVIQQKHFDSIQKINLPKSIELVFSPDADNKVIWFQFALKAATGDIVVVAAQIYQYKKNSFSYAASIFSQYPQCGALLGQIKSLENNNATHIGPYDILPLLRYDYLPEIGLIFFAKSILDERISFCDDELLTAVLLWIIHDVPLLNSQYVIAEKMSPLKQEFDSVDLIIQNAKKRLSLQNRLVERNSDDETVKIFDPYAKTEILCHAAEQVEQIEGVSKRFLDILKRAEHFSKGTDRLARLKAKASTHPDAESYGNMMPVDPNFNTQKWWDTRYAAGGHSGLGSHTVHYLFKRDYVNSVIRRYDIQSVVDFGCGDGSQIEEINVISYQGIDVSASAVERCRNLYKNRFNYSFNVYDEVHLEEYDMAMSLDVLYHVVEPEQYDLYLQRLFSHSRYVLIYTNILPRLENSAHMLYRDHIQEITKRNFSVQLIERIMNPNLPTVGFLLYKKAL